MSHIDIEHYQYFSSRYFKRTCIEFFLKKCVTKCIQHGKDICKRNYILSHYQYITDDYLSLTILKYYVTPEEPKNRSDQQQETE